MSSFVEIAEHYEDLMSGVPYPMWVSYLKLLWANYDVKPKNVLEICCGTGTMCRLLEKEGYSATGVDISEQMIAKARELSPTIEYYAQNAAEMNLGKRFDAAFSFFDSFNYIADPDACREAIHRAAKHLVPGGLFAMDLNTAYAFEEKMFDQQNLKPAAKVRYKWRSSWLPETRICTVDMEFWAGNNHFKEVHVQRAHSQEEIGRWMAEAGFESVKFYDAYTLDPPRGRSDRIHTVGKMPMNPPDGAVRTY